MEAGFARELFQRYLDDAAARSSVVGPFGVDEDNGARRRSLLAAGCGQEHRREKQRGKDQGAGEVANPNWRRGRDFSAEFPARVNGWKAYSTIHRASLPSGMRTWAVPPMLNIILRDWFWQRGWFWEM